MTEEQIEHRVEKMTDRLDARFLNSPMTQEEYDAELARISAWADCEYKASGLFSPWGN